MSLMEGIYIQAMDYEVEIYTDFSFLNSDSVVKLILHSHLFRTNILGTLPTSCFHKTTICNIKIMEEKHYILSVYSHLCFVSSGTCSLIFK